MFIAPALTLGVEALRATLPGSLDPAFFPADADYDRDYRDGAHPEWARFSIHTAYPKEEISFPGVWVNFTTMGDAYVAGIGHIEYAATQTEEGLAAVSPVYRWRFGGSYEMTVACLSNLERAKAVDALALMIGMGGQEAAPSPFREAITGDAEYIEINAQMGALGIGGFAETPGTPWGSDDVVYEATVTLDVEGSIVVDPKTRALVPLTAVIIHERREDEPQDPALLPDGAAGGWR